jgi:hypothetical protein
VAPRLAGVVAGAVLLAALGACSADRDTPTARVRAVLARAETAAEKRDLGELRQLISDKYTDSQGQDKRAIEGVLRYYFLRNERIHLLTRIQAVTFPEPGKAQATVFVAMAGQPLRSPEEIERLRADLHRFEIAFVNEGGEWRAVRAEWRRAELNDFL